MNDVASHLSETTFRVRVSIADSLFARQSHTLSRISVCSLSSGSAAFLVCDSLRLLVFGFPLPQLWLPRTSCAFVVSTSSSCSLTLPPTLLVVSFSLSLPAQQLFRSNCPSCRIVMAVGGVSSDACSGDRAGKGLAMEDRGWSDLPDDVVEMIVRPLPLASKLNCTNVCKSWNAGISANRLLGYATNAQPSGQPLFLLSTRGKSACGLDPSTGIWQTLFKPECPGASILAAGGGLMCVGNQVSECRVLCVCNPWMKVSKQLPKMPRVRLIHKVSMAVDDTTNAYVILVTGEDGSNFRGRHEYTLHTEVYDSISGSWLGAGDALPEAKFGSDPGVWWNGLYYCITELPYGLTAFDLAKGLWIELPVEMPEGLSSPSLVSCRDQLLIVSLYTDPSLSPSISLRIWSLCNGTTLQVFTQMPEDLCTEFTSHSTGRTPLICSGVGDMICITSHRSPVIVVYNIRNGLWKLVPADPLFPKYRDSHLLGFLLQPQFDCIP